MRIYLDMDGVIVNLRDRVVELFSEEFLTELDSSPTTDTSLWGHVHETFGQEFWANLDWMPDGQALLAFLEDEFGRANISICTKPTKFGSSLDGKQVWIEQNIPVYSNAYIMVREKERVANPQALLIDDAPKNVAAFRKAGGKALLVPRPWNREGWNNSDTLPCLIEQVKGALAKA